MGITSQMITSVGLPSAAIIALSSLVALTVRSILNGRLVPLRSYDEMKARFEAALAVSFEQTRNVEKERDRWRAAAESLSEQNAELLTNQDLTLAVLNSIKAAAHAKDGDET